MELHGIRTYFDRLSGGVVEVEDDVANVVRDIHAISPRIHVYWNEQTEKFDLVEECLDDTHRLIFSVQSLDARVLTRLKVADQWRGQDAPAHLLPEDEDFLSIIDADDEKERADLKEMNMDRVRDAGERLAWAGEQDRKGVGAQISVPRALSDD